MLQEDDIKMQNEVEEDLHNRKPLMDWTSKQGRILTANGKSASYYTAARGFPYLDIDLPHHHLINNTTDTFLDWAKGSQGESQSQDELEGKRKPNDKHDRKQYPICGAFCRPLFVGGWEHSTDEEENVYNVQTNTLFIDIRIPKLGRLLMKNANGSTCGDDGGGGVKGLSQLSDEQLKLYARRHAFAGYTKLYTESIDGTGVCRDFCVRHHCIDWNFVGIPRNRPNKWYVEMEPTDKKVWKELAYAKDNFGQHYYLERWERYERDGMGNGLVLALRRDKKENDPNHRDGIIVAVGDHFNYIFGRNESLIDTLLSKEGATQYKNKGNTVALIDEAVDNGDRELAEEFLSIDAGHGCISKGWKIDASTQPWKEGTSLFGSGVDVSIQGSGMGPGSKIAIGEHTYTIYESNITAEEFKQILLVQNNGCVQDIDSYLLDNRQPLSEYNVTKKRKSNPDE